jgi:acetolactate synthase-1/2/3 large subunit
MTTPSGRGSIREDHPLSIGQVGLYRTQLGMQASENADLLITVGSRNEEFQTGAWRIFPTGARFVQIDIAPFEIGRNWLPDVAILGDAKLVLSDLLETLPAQPRAEWRARGAEWAQAKRAYEAEVAAECLREERPLGSKRVVFELNQVFGRETILVHENGSQDLWSYYSPYYQVLDWNGVVAPGEQTCMGAGVTGCIGAKLAHPDKKVVCVTGDGAFQMYGQDLPTAKQYNAAVTWVVLNNFGLGWPKYGQKHLDERYIAVDFEVQPDFARFAEACGCYGERVDAPEDVRPALERALHANSTGIPAVLDFVVDPWDLPEGFHVFHGLRA